MPITIKDLLYPSIFKEKNIKCFEEVQQAYTYTIFNSGDFSKKSRI